MENITFKYTKTWKPKRYKHYKSLCFYFDNNQYKMKNFIVIYFNFPPSSLGKHQLLCFLSQII